MPRVISAAVLCAATLLAGCAQYVDRKETVAFSAGNAVRTNIVTQVIDPWPRHARQTRIYHDGDRLQRAVERYRTNQGAPRPAAGPATAPANGPPGEQPPANGAAPPAGGSSR